MADLTKWSSEVIKRSVFTDVFLWLWWLCFVHMCVCTHMHIHRHAYFRIFWSWPDPRQIVTQAMVSLALFKFFLCLKVKKV